MIHYSFIGYIVATAIILLVCVVAYRLLLENRVVPWVNRRFLLSIYGLMILVPLIVALIPESSANISFNINVGELKAEGVVENPGEIQPVNSTFEIIRNILPWLVYAYYAGVVIMLIFSICMFSHLVLLINQSKIMEINGTEVYVHNVKKLSSFSWFNRILLYNESIENSSKNMNILLRHELAHLERFHWIDLVLAQTVIIFQWFNPAAWFMRNELQRIHEYEADEAVLESGVNESEYQMFLINNISRNRFSGLTDGLNNCSLKKRIVMMKKKTFKSNWVTRGLALAAFAVVGGAVIHIPVVASSLSMPEKTESETTFMEKQIPNQTKTDEKVYIAVDKVAEYPGGQKQLIKDLSKTIRYPEEAYKADIQGRVVVRFQINKDGSVSNCKVIRGVDPTLDAEAVRVVENLPGKWIPGEVNGKPVASVFNMPVSFKLENDSEEKSK